ncbi:hypothetical protein J4439_07380 [Candidatus Woesearchaeota archaeon]|nr:hypothetical protein [Candidatus Woesearchaeota archaeon]
MKRTTVIAEDAHPLGERWYVKLRILRVLPSSACPEGVSYAMTLIDLRTGKRVFALDNRGGHGHHMHIRGMRTPYRFVDITLARRDFWQGVKTIRDSAAD